MASVERPSLKPANPNFSSGPCRKRPGYNLMSLDASILGRSHRSAKGKAMLAKAIDKTKKLLQLPEDYRVGITPASNTGAFEMALWSMLGPRPVDLFYWEAFGTGWHTDIVEQLQLPEVRSFHADYGYLPDLSQANSDHDIVFTWNGTASGVCVANADWIDDRRQGLTFCDATSAVFAMPIAWDKLDVATFSWQKALGGEAAHGMLILSPAAVERLQSWTPAHPLPKIFRLTKNNQLMEAVFKGETINTPSMLCVADYLDALNWLAGLGGLSSSIQRCRYNMSIVEQFVAHNDWVNFLAQDNRSRSNTSVCLTVDLSDNQLNNMVKLLEDERVAFDIKAYRGAPLGLRIWCGPTVESNDLRLLMPWLKWAYEQRL